MWRQRTKRLHQSIGQYLAPCLVTILCYCTTTVPVPTKKCAWRRGYWCEHWPRCQWRTQAQPAPAVRPKGFRVLEVATSPWPYQPADAVARAETRGGRGHPPSAYAHPWLPLCTAACARMICFVVRLRPSSPIRKRADERLQKGVPSLADGCWYPPAGLTVLACSAHTHGMIHIRHGGKKIDIDAERQGR